MADVQPQRMPTTVDPRHFRHSFLTYGYHTIDKLLDDDELAAARAHVNAILAGRTSFPVDAFDRERGPSDIGSEPVVRKLKDIAKNDEFFCQLSRHERILDLIQEIIGPDIKLHASIGWMKPVRIGSPKSPHQDSAYWTHIEPPEFVVCWVALDDATTDNGCLHFVPGSHKHGIVPHSSQGEVRVPDESVPYRQAVAAPMPAGGASFHFGTTVHWSGPNHSCSPRRAVSFAYMSARCALTESWRGKISFDLLRGRSYEGCV